MSEGTSSGDKGGRVYKYVPAVGPRLKKLLYVVLGLFSLLFINGAYLVGITIAEWSTGEAIQNYFKYLDLMSDGREATVSNLEKASKHLNSANEGLAELNLGVKFSDTHGAQDSLVGARARASVEAVMRGDKEIPDFDTLDRWVNNKAVNVSYRKVVSALRYFSSCRRDVSPDTAYCIEFLKKVEKYEAQSVFQKVLGAEDYFSKANREARKTVTADGA